MDLNSPAPRGPSAAPPSFLPQPVGKPNSGGDASQTVSNFDYSAGINAQAAFDDNFLISTATEPLVRSRPAPPPPVRKPTPANDEDGGKFNWGDALQGAPPWLG